MSIKLFWRCEGTSLSGTHDHSDGDTSTSGINGGALTAEAARIGSFGILRPSSQAGGFNFNAPGIFPGTVTAPTDSVGSIALSVFYPVAVDTGTSTAAGLRFRGTASPNDNFGFRPTGTGGYKFSMQSVAGGTINLATQDLITVGSWFGVVARWDFPNNKRRIELYDASGTKIDEAEDYATNIQAFIPPDISSGTNGINTGTAGASFAQNIYYDNLFIANAFDEPLQNNLTITSYTEYDGSLPEEVVSSVLMGQVWTQ